MKDNHDNAKLLLLKIRITTEKFVNNAHFIWVLLFFTYIISFLYRFNKLRSFVVAFVWASSKWITPARNNLVQIHSLSTSNRTENMYVLIERSKGYRKRQKTHSFIERITVRVQCTCLRICYDNRPLDKLLFRVYASVYVYLWIFHYFLFFGWSLLNAVQRTENIVVIWNPLFTNN